MGTVYTARYRPGEAWEQSFENFTPGTRTVTLG